MRRVLLLAAISGFLTVAIGAFAAHGLRAVLDARQLGWIDTGLRGQGWHTLVLLAIAILMASKPSPLLHTAAAAFALGILLFSGGLYALALVGPGTWTVVTPVGGVSLLAGWLLLIVYALRLPRGG